VKLRSEESFWPEVELDWAWWPEDGSVDMVEDKDA
jgi:hypothetical protein